MENTLAETYKGLLTEYENKNRRNAPRTGRAVGRLCGVIADIENNVQLTDFARKILLRDLKYIYENVNDIEL